MLDPDAVLRLALQPLGDGDDVVNPRFADFEVGQDDPVAGDGRAVHGYRLTLLCVCLTHARTESAAFSSLTAAPSRAP